MGAARWMLARGLELVAVVLVKVVWLVDELLLLPDILLSSPPIPALGALGLVEEATPLTSGSTMKV